jgi:hypothetical protein
MSAFAAPAAFASNFQLGGACGAPAPAPVYAAESIAGNGGVVSYDPGTPIFYTTPGCAPTVSAAGDATGVIQVRFTLGGGAVFNSNPAVIAVFGPGCALAAPVPAAGGAGNPFVAYNVTVTVPAPPGTAGPCTVVVDNFIIAGAGSLGNPGGSLTMSAQSFLLTGGPLTDFTDPFPKSITIAKSASELFIFAAAAGSAINTLSPSFAKQFITGTTVSNQGIAGGVVIAQNGVLLDASGAPFAFLVGTATVTVSGNFPNISGAYVTSAGLPGSGCPATPPGGGTSVNASSVSATGLSFTGVPFAAGGTFYAICVITNGMGVLFPDGSIQAAAAGPFAVGNFSVSVQADVGALDQSVVQTATALGYGYNGGPVLLTYELTGATPLGTPVLRSILRLVNLLPVNEPVGVVVFVDGPNGQTSGTPSSNPPAFLIETLAPLANDTLVVGAFLAANNVAASPTQRVALLVLPPLGVGVSAVEQNPPGQSVFSHLAGNAF